MRHAWYAVEYACVCTRRNTSAGRSFDPAPRRPTAQAAAAGAAVAGAAAAGAVAAKSAADKVSEHGARAGCLLAAIIYYTQCCAHST